MNRKERVIVALGIVVAVALMLGLIRFEFYVWRLQHPQAPTWTFFAHP